jgi:uncharacterized membrane protein YoaK (UPF0700 family)
LISLAMGMMNPAVSKIGPEPVSPTFVTGTLNRIGGHLAAALGPTSLPDSTESRSSHLLRAGIDASMWSGFFIGAVLSGLVGSSLKAWALWPPCLIITALVGFGHITSSPDVTVSNSNGQTT